MRLTKKRYTSTFAFIFFSVVFILGITYLMWRWMYTLNLYTSPLTTFWTYALLWAEILTLIVFTNFGLIILKANNLEKIEPSNKLQQDYTQDIFHNGELLTFKNFCPSVDVFICTLNETPDMLSTTISACKNVDYPNHKVYILDDGRRQEIKELTEMLGCNYITRQTNKGFKAGNINNALEQTSGEIIVIFDADHIAAATFLRETIYNFIDEKVALVQTPQHFCNPDAFQKNLADITVLANEQEVFYRIMEPALNEFDSVFCGGTNILIRRKHLETVGKFPENTITEDSLLGLIFHANGYNVVYYNRPIAIGLSASSFEEYIKQRARWAKGNVQIVTTPSNWKYYAKLKPIQMFFYLSGVMYFFTPFARLIFLFAPIMFLFFDISTVIVLFYQIIAFQLCYFSLKFAFIFSSRMKVSNVVFADVYDLVTSIFTFGSILHALLLHGKLAKIKFSVTNKNLEEGKTNYRYKAPLVIIFIILICAELQGFYDIFFSEPYSVLAIIANIFWNTINLIVMYYGIKAVTEKPERRYYQRVNVDNEVTLEDNKHHKYQAHVDDISRSGVKVISPLNLKEKVEDFSLNLQGEEAPIEIVECTKNNEEQYVCKSKFKEPFSLLEITKKYVDRLDKFVRFTYKNPVKWDNYFNDDNENGH